MLRQRAVEDRMLLQIAAADALKGAQLKSAQGHDVGLDPHHPHLLTTKETLHDGHLSRSHSGRHATTPLTPYAW
jgi:hypothetical protein